LARVTLARVTLARVTLALPVPRRSAQAKSATTQLAKTLNTYYASATQCVVADEGDSRTDRLAEDLAVIVHINGESQQINDGTSLSNLLAELRINRQLVAVEVNAELVPREDHDQCVLNAGDRLEIVTLVGGG
jgi:sulfur carrier protein